MGGIGFTRGAGVVIATVLVGLAALAAPASAATTTASDPTHDNGPAFDPRGDVTSYSVSYDGSTVTVTATVAAFADPLTDPFWTTQPVSIFFFIGTDVPNARSFEVEYGGGAVAPVYVNGASRPIHMCDATATSSAADGSYSATLPASCVDSPVKVRMGLRFWDQGQSGSPLSVDTADTTDYAAGPAPTTTSTSTSTTIEAPTTTSTEPALTPSEVTTTTERADGQRVSTSLPATVRAAAASTTTATGAGNELPFTGGSTGPLVLLAVTFLAAGSGLVVRGKRRN